MVKQIPHPDLFNFLEVGNNFVSISAVKSFCLSPEKLIHAEVSFKNDGSVLFSGKVLL